MGVELNEIREKIDEIDEQILQLLKKRYAYVDKILEYKLRNNMDICDIKREKEKIKGLNEDEKTLIELIMNLSKKRQSEKKKQMIVIKNA